MLEKYKNFAQKIIDLKNVDLELREKLIQEKQLGDGYHEEMRALHNQNALHLNEIIDEIGFPSIKKVGKEASDAAWLIVQHAIEQPQLMKKHLELLTIAVQEKEADEVNLAYLTDRIAVFENKPQWYGTQFDWDKNGLMSPNECDDLEKVNQRRNNIGLCTIEEQTEIIRNRVKNENQLPPKDFEKRKKEIELWKTKVGWVNPNF